MKKGFDIWAGTIITILVSVPIIAAIIQISHEAAKITFVSNHGVVTIVILIGGYALIWTTFKSIDKVAGQLGDVASKATGGARKWLSNARSNSMKNRGALWRQGQLFDNSGIGGGFNELGRSIGAATAGNRLNMGALLPTRRGRAARASYDEILQHQAVEQSQMLKVLQNDDTANAVLAGTGGVNSRAALEQSARDLGLTEADGSISAAGEAAISKAQATGITRTSAMAALRTAMQNKARGFSNGNVRAVDNFVRRLATNEEEYNRLAYDTAYHARSGGRADLGGTDFVSYRQDNTTWQNAKAVTAAAALANPTLNADQLDNIAWQNVADSNMVNGYGRVGIGAFTGGHDSQIIQAAETFARVLQTAPVGSDARFDAAVNLKEMQGNIQQMSGTARDRLNTILYGSAQDGNLELDVNGAISEQLAWRTGRQGATGATLTTVGRVWPEMSMGGQYYGPQPTQPTQPTQPQPTRAVTQTQVIGPPGVGPNAPGDPFQGGYTGNTLPKTGSLSEGRHALVRNAGPNNQPPQPPYQGGRNTRNP